MNRTLCIPPVYKVLVVAYNFILTLVVLERHSRDNLEIVLRPPVFHSSMHSKIDMDVL